MAFSPKRYFRSLSLQRKQLVLTAIPLTGIIALAAVLTTRNLAEKNQTDRAVERLRAGSEQIQNILNFLDVLGDETAEVALYVRGVKENVSSFEAAVLRTDEMAGPMMASVEVLSAAIEATLPPPNPDDAERRATVYERVQGQLDRLATHRESVRARTMRPDQIWMTYPNTARSLFGLCADVSSLLGHLELEHLFDGYTAMYKLKLTNQLETVAYRMIAGAGSMDVFDYETITYRKSEQGAIRGDFNRFAPEEVKALLNDKFKELDVGALYGKLNGPIRSWMRKPAEGVAISAEAPDAYAAAMKACYVAAQDLYREKIARSASLIQASDQRGFFTALAFTLLIFMASVASNYFLGGNIKKTLDGVSIRLSRAAGTVSQSAAEFSGASQELLRDASNTAASLETVSASIVEMNASMHQDEKRVLEAHDLAEESRKSASNGQESIEHLKSAMEAIGESSGKIAKILGTIQDIAFQTNILALNAAVEAARAGEHGTGFSVVAEEVRALAQRSAVATAEITKIMAESDRNTELGNSRTTAVEESFAGISEQISTVDRLLGEIRESALEKSRGIEVISSSIREQETASQSSVEVADRNRESSDRLLSETDSLRESIDTLDALLGKRASALRLTTRRRSAPAQIPSRQNRAAVGGRVARPREVPLEK